MEARINYKSEALENKELNYQLQHMKNEIATSKEHEQTSLKQNGFMQELQMKIKESLDLVASKGTQKNKTTTSNYDYPFLKSAVATKDADMNISSSFFKLLKDVEEIKQGLNTQSIENTL